MCYHVEEAPIDGHNHSFAYMLSEFYVYLCL
jgi:hypothetical protein